MKTSEMFPAKYLKVADLKGRRLTVTIDEVLQEEVGEDDKFVVYFKETKIKPLVLNKTNASMIEEIAGADDTDDWVGIKIGLYPTRVDFQGKRVDAIRIEVPKEARTREPGEDDAGQEALA